MPLDEQTERLESLKAGLIGAGAISAVLLPGWALLQVQPGVQALIMPYLLSRGTLEAGIVHLAIAGLSGFLFGITYRYIVRKDNNRQLKTGGVLAFSLVRGLAEMEPHIELASVSEWFLLPLAESLVLFVVAGIALEAAMQLNLLSQRD